MKSTRHDRNQARLGVELLENRCLLSAVLRTIDGTDNNPLYPDWGAANTQLLRDFTVAYGDGISSPAGAARPSARAVSNAVLAQTESLPSQRRLSAMVFQWGQFLDHDLDLTENAVPLEPFPIPVPAGDPHFDPQGLGGQVIPLNRSAYDPMTGIDTPRQQLNAITAFVDASNVYGSDAVRAAALRTGVGGRLQVTPHSSGDLLPFNTAGLPNAGGPSPTLFLAGDVRANEQVGLTALHTLFVREHNRLADEIAAAHPTWTDEQIYQRARKFVGAQMQVITYNEFLPAVLGPSRLPRYRGYDPHVNPGISNLFSTAAFRVGHTMLPGQLLRLDNNGNVIPQGHLALRDAFFHPDRILNEGGIDPLLKGLAGQVQQEIDARIIDDVRNFLFGPPGAGGFDLASLNIQRGREHGLPSYNQARVDMGLAPARSFADITSDVNVQTALGRVYANVNEVDVWVGGIAEDHLRGSSLGELFTAVWVDQFTRSRDGDRFYYENDPAFSRSDIAHLRNTTLADIIERNTGIRHLKPNVFFVHAGKKLTAAFVHAGKKLTAAFPANNPVNGTLHADQVRPLLTEALARWQAAGFDVSALHGIDVRIADLGGLALGRAADAVTWLDDNAAGWGWFYPTPGEDSEFTTSGEQGGMDLLTVLAHELGHELGLEHDEDGVMADTLAPGVRRMPGDQADWLAAAEAGLVDLYPVKRRS